MEIVGSEDRDLVAKASLRHRELQFLISVARNDVVRDVGDLHKGDPVKAGTYYSHMPARSARSWTGQRVTVTGGRGFLGTPLVRMLEAAGANVATFSSHQYNLTKQTDVARMYADLKPEIVIHLAARVGGIGPNRDNPGTFFYANATLDITLIEQLPK